MSKAKRGVPDNVVAIVSEQLFADPLLPHPEPTQSAWQLPPHPQVANIQSAKLAERVDFAIIGSGVTACGAARALLGDNRSGSKTVAVFEARKLCSSATGRNGGQLTRVPPTRHDELVQQLGVQQANKIIRFNLETLKHMHALAETQGAELEADCRHVRVEKCFGYYDSALFGEMKRALSFYESQLPEERGIYRIISKEEAISRYNLKNPVGGLCFPAGVVSPYRLITNTFQNLLKTYPSRLMIETETPVLEIKYEPNKSDQYPYQIRTPRGNVYASTVVHCTNGHTGHLVPGLRGSIYPTRGVMSSQFLGDQFPDMSRQQSWSFFLAPNYDDASKVVERGHYYGHQHPTTREFWLGGHRDGVTGFISADDSTVEPHAGHNIKSIPSKLFGSQWTMVSKDDSFKVWSGVMAWTGDGLPLVGQLPTMATGRQGTGEWVAAGYNSWGMPNGLRCGTAVAEMILGHDVSGWFPEAYVLSEERLKGPAFEREHILADYFARTEIFDPNLPQRKKMSKL